MKLMSCKHRFGAAVCHLAFLRTSEEELLMLVHRAMIRLLEFGVGRSADSCRVPERRGQAYPAHGADVVLALRFDHRIAT